MITTDDPGAANAVQHRPSDHRRGAGERKEKFRNASRRRWYGRMLNQGNSVKVPMSRDDLRSRLESGENIAWSTRAKEEGGRWPDRCRFFIVQQGQLPRGGSTVRVEEDDVEDFLDELERRALQAYSDAAHPSYLTLRLSDTMRRAGYRWTRTEGPIRTMAVAAVVLVALLISVPGGVRAAGWTPVTPGQNTPQAQAAVSGLGFGPSIFWEAATFAFNQSYTPPTTHTCTPTCGYLMDAGWSNLTYISPPLPPGAFLSSIPPELTAVNEVQSCGQSCFPSQLECDGALYGPGPILGHPCFSLEILWPSPGPVYTGIPSFFVERIQTWVFPVPGAWIVVPCSSMTASASLVDYGPGFFNSEYVNHIVSWQVISAAWIQPYPSGEIMLANTFHVIDKSSNTQLPSTQYLVGTTYSLLEWTDLPFPPFEGTGETEFAQNLTQPYFFQVSLSCSGPGGIGGTSTTNSSGKANYPGGGSGPQLPPQEVVLLLGNITTINSGNLSASVEWTNPNTFNFTGTFLLEAPFLPGSSDIRLFEDGSPASPGTFVVANDTITVVQDTAPVASGSSITFQVDYEKGSTYAAGQTVLVVNGAGLNLGQLVMLALLILALIVGLLVWWERGWHDQIPGVVVGLAGIGLLAWSWLGT